VWQRAARAHLLCQSGQRCVQGLADVVVDALVREVGSAVVCGEKGRGEPLHDVRQRFAGGQFPQTPLVSHVVKDFPGVAQRTHDRREVPWGAEAVFGRGQEGVVGSRAGRHTDTLPVKTLLT